MQHYAGISGGAFGFWPFTQAGALTGSAKFVRQAPIKLTDPTDPSAGFNRPEPMGYCLIFFDLF